MARRRQEPQHHANRQRRYQRTHEFRAELPDEQLYRIIAEVARDVHPDEPERLGQQQFDENRARVAQQLDLPVPPRANAIYLRLNKGRPKEKRRSWRLIVEHALRGNHVRRVTVDERAEPAWFQDEGYVVYSLRRAADHLGIELGEPGAPPDPYDRAVRELIEADRRLRRGGLLEDLLLTSAQIKTIADEAGWDGAWQLAGYLAPVKEPSTIGFDPVRMLAHYYETKPGLPPSYEELRKHAARMDIPIPSEKTAKLSEVRARFISERAARGLETPKEGPLPEQALTPAEIEALLDGAPRQRRKGYWLVLENVLEALAEYVDEYDGREPLRQHHYNAARKGRGWPAVKAIDACARRHGIGVDTKTGPFQSMIELARRRAIERRRKAA